MEYYHGSRIKDLKELTIEKSNDGYVWLTEQYEFALLYAGNSVRFWDFNFKTNKLIIREVAEDCLKKMYKNKECFIYVAKDVGDYEQSDHHGRRSIRCKHNVTLELKEHVLDAYDKIMELYDKGIIEIRFWNGYTKEEQERKIKILIKHFGPVMQDEHDRFPDEYKLLTELRPELKLENLQFNEDINATKRNGGDE